MATFLTHLTRRLKQSDFLRGQITECCFDGPNRNTIDIGVLDIFSDRVASVPGSEASDVFPLLLEWIVTTLYPRVLTVYTDQLLSQKIQDYNATPVHILQALETAPKFNTTLLEDDDHDDLTLFVSIVEEARRAIYLGVLNTLSWGPGGRGLSGASHENSRRVLLGICAALSRCAYLADTITTHAHLVDGAYELIAAELVFMLERAAIAHTTAGHSLSQVRMMLIGFLDKQAIPRIYPQYDDGPTAQVVKDVLTGRG